MDSLARYWLDACGVGGCAGGCAGDCAGDEAIGCCGRFFVGFIDVVDFVVVGLTLRRSISRRSRKSPRFPYILIVLFRCRLDREKCCLERLLSSFYARRFFDMIFCLREKNEK
jgi:hypothetical protein